MTGRRVARNFLALGAGEAVARLIAFGVTIYLARIVTPDGYGVLALAMGVNLYLAKVADFGIETAGTKEVSDDPETVEALGSAVLSLRLLLATLVMVVAALASLLFLPAPEGPVLALFTLTLLPVAGSTRWIHVGLEDARPVGLARIVAELGVLGATVAFVSGIEDLWVVPVVQFAGEVVVSGLLLGVLVRRGYRFGVRWDPERALPVFRRGFPLLVQVLLGLLIYNADVVFLRILRDRADVGWYAAAYALVSFMANLGMAWGMSLLPALSRAGKGPEGDVELYRTGIAQAWTVALPVAVGAFVLAEGIIGLGFGAGYEPSVAILQLLAVSIPVMVIRNLAWYGLVARARGAVLTSIMAAAVVVNFALNLALIPRYGILGAGAATVATELLICVWMLRRASTDGLRFVPPGRLMKATVASAAMAAALVWLPVGGVVVPTVAGAAVFAGALTLLGGVRWRPTPALTV